MNDFSFPSWANSWRQLRDDVNVLAWLFEEERVTQRLYIESAFWALTGKSFSVAEFAKEVGIDTADQGTVDDAERSAESALE